MAGNVEPWVVGVQRLRRRVWPERDQRAGISVLTRCSGRANVFQHSDHDGRATARETQKQATSGTCLNAGPLFVHAHCDVNAWSPLHDDD